MLPNERAKRFTMQDIRFAKLEHNRLQVAIDGLKATKYLVIPEIWKDIVPAFRELKKRQVVVGNALREHGQEAVDDNQLEEEILDLRSLSLELELASERKKED